MPSTMAIRDVTHETIFEVQLGAVLLRGLCEGDGAREGQDGAGAMGGLLLGVLELLLLGGLVIWNQATDLLRKRQVWAAEQGG